MKKLITLAFLVLSTVGIAKDMKMEVDKADDNTIVISIKKK
ncbi:hypothetical protein [Cetobacterium sp. ZOR0034]|jgi:hypothetical protein|nr:hypothetical protein [Cetobacterium sp. ZOR0034]